MTRFLRPSQVFLLVQILELGKKLRLRLFVIVSRERELGEFISGGDAGLVDTPVTTEQDHVSFPRRFFF